jgi:hypothetical protein
VAAGWVDSPAQCAHRRPILLVRRAIRTVAQALASRRPRAVGAGVRATGMSTTHPPHGGPLTRRQLRLLRALALERGQSFTPPATNADASREIRRLQGAQRQTSRDGAIERRQLERVSTPSDASSIQAREVTGYGSSARWAHMREGRS